MATNFPTYIRLEPQAQALDLDAGFAAAIHDPLWFLGRQWQMGEHQGENASSPVWIDYTLHSRTITAADARFDPSIVPAEAIVESEVNDWWTLGRRIRIGRRLAATHPALLAQPELTLVAPPPPYERFHGQLDGLAVWQARVPLGIDDGEFGAIIPPERAPAWQDEALLYQQTVDNAFRAGDRRLVVQRHRGGRMDWSSVDAAPVANGEAPAAAPLIEEEGAALPTQLHYPGAPADRWWQFEDAQVDPGTYAPDSAHTPTAFLTDLIVSHSNDWFLFPVSSPAGHRAGQVVAIAAMQVHDGFGRVYASNAIDEVTALPVWPGLQPPSDWTLFKVDGLRLANELENEGVAGHPGLASSDLVLWHVAELPLESTPLEQVQFGLDEAANLLWAVERIVTGRAVESLPDPRGEDGLTPHFNSGSPSGDARSSHAKEYAYVPARGIAPYWHPYVLSEEDAPRRLERRRLVDLTRQQPVPMPDPQAEILRAKRILPLTIPSNGVSVERNWQLARDMHGAPVLWIQRRRRPLLAPPARRLRFDVLEEAAV
jgi:hypothetical protein